MLGSNQGTKKDGRVVKNFTQNYFDVSIESEGKTLQIKSSKQLWGSLQKNSGYN
jgi:hypothetical protein